MLFLRRIIGQSITVLFPENDVNFVVKVVDFDLDEEWAEFEITGEDGPVTLQKNESILCFQGTVKILNHKLFEFVDFPDAVSIGLEPPRDTVIYRTELIRGMNREQLNDLRKRNIRQPPPVELTVGSRNTGNRRPENETRKKTEKRDPRMAR